MSEQAIQFSEVADGRDRTTEAVEQSLQSDRSDYWIKAHQLCWAFMLTDWLQSPRLIQDPLHNLRMRLTYDLQNLLSKGYMWWADMSLRADAGETFEGIHTPAFLFLLLRHHFDHQRAVGNTDTELQAYDFYCHFMDMIKENMCSCGSCIQVMKMWINDNPSTLIMKTLRLSDSNIKHEQQAMMSWKAEHPSLRQTEEYLRQQEIFKSTPSVFGALGAEYHAFHRMAHPATASMFKLITAKKLNRTRRPNAQDVVEVTDLEELEDEDCVICCSAFDTEQSTSGMPSSSFGQHRPSRARCGHILCLKCYETIIKESTSRRRRCPFCRASFVAPPTWYTMTKELVNALHDRSSAREKVVNLTIKSLEDMIAALPTFFRNHGKFVMIEACIGSDPHMFTYDERVQDLLHNVLGSTSNVLGWVNSTHYSTEDEGRWAYQLLRLNGERLDAFRDGDTARYRHVLNLLWPVFVRYSSSSFVKQVKLWAREIEVRERIFRIAPDGDRDAMQPTAETLALPM